MRTKAISQLGSALLILLTLATPLLAQTQEQIVESQGGAVIDATKIAQEQLNRGITAVNSREEAQIALNGQQRLLAKIQQAEAEGGPTSQSTQARNTLQTTTQNLARDGATSTINPKEYAATSYSPVSDSASNPTSTNTSQWQSESDATQAFALADAHGNASNSLITMVDSAGQQYDASGNPMASAIGAVGSLANSSSSIGSLVSSTQQAGSTIIQVANAAQAKEYGQMLSEHTLNLSPGQAMNLADAQSGNRTSQIDIMGQGAQQEYGGLLQDSANLETERQNELTQLSSADTEDKKLNVLLEMENTVGTEKVLSARAWALKSEMAQVKREQENVHDNSEANGAQTVNETGISAAGPAY